MSQILLAAFSRTSRTFTYVSDGDANGVLYFLGTNFGSIAWTNPHTAGRCVVVRSSDEGGGAVDIVDRATNNTFSADAANSYISIDLGALHLLVLNKLTLRNRSFADRAIRNFRIQGSNNSAGNSIAQLNAATWANIAVYSGDTTMAANADQFASYDGWSVPAGYRWIRILQDGLNSSGDNYLTLAEIEYYGTFTF